MPITNSPEEIGGTEFPGHGKIEPLLVTGCAFVLFALTRSENLALSHDSVGYLLDIEAGGARLFHPHHLLFNAVAYVWLGAGNLIGVSSEDSASVALLNSVFGALSAGTLFMLMVDRAQIPRRLALTCTAGAVASFGFWFYSGNVEVYMLPLFFLLAALYLVLSQSLTRVRIVALGLLHGLAMLAHQINVLFGVVLVTALWLGRSRQKDGFAFSVFLYILSGTAVVALGYGLVLAAAVRPSSAEQAWSWFTLYAQSDSYGKAFSFASIVQAFIGLSRAFIGGHFVFGLETLRDFMATAFPDKSLVDEAFLVRNFSSGKSYSLLLGSGVFGIGFISVVIGGMFRLSRAPLTRKGVALLTTIWIASYSLFFLYWQPQNLEFWIPQVTALWVLLAILWVPEFGESKMSGYVRTVVLPLLVVVLFGVNLFGTILPATNAANDVYARRYQLLSTAVSPGDLVVVNHPHLGVGYTHRLTDAEPVSLTEPFQVGNHTNVQQVMATLAARFEDALDNGHRVFIEPAVVESNQTMLEGQVARMLKAQFEGRWRTLRIASDIEYFVIEP